MQRKKEFEVSAHGKRPNCIPGIGGGGKGEKKPHYIGVPVKFHTGKKLQGIQRFFFQCVNVSLLVVYSLFFLYLMVFMSVCPMSIGLLVGKEFFHKVEINLLI